MNLAQPSSPLNLGHSVILAKFLLDTLPTGHYNTTKQRKSNKIVPGDETPLHSL